MTKLAAIGTALTGAVTAITSSMTTGFAITAAGASTYAAAKNIPAQGYDKTKHVPPAANKPQAGPARHERLMLAKKEVSAKPKNAPVAGTSPSRNQPTRTASKSLIVRKRN